MDKKLNAFERVYPWYGGFAADLLFWVAIDTLFLNQVKGLDSATIVLLVTVSSIVSIFVQLPLTQLTKLLGNTVSIRVGALLAMASIVFLTLGNNFAPLLIGMCLREISYSLKTLSGVVLEHNLAMQGRGEEFVRQYSKSTNVYALTTMVISLIASPLYNLHRYLPSLLCFVFCTIVFVLSFWIVDYSPNGTGTLPAQEKKDKPKFSLKFPYFILLLMVFYGVFYGILTYAQDDAKLFIQDALSMDFSENTTALVIGAILFISRVVRVGANIVYAKAHKALQNTAGILMAALLFLSFVLLISGFFIQGNPILKYTVMCLGYLAILFVRDPMKIYINDLALKNTEVKDHQRVIMVLELFKKILVSLVGITVSAILVSNTMMVALLFLASLTAAVIGIGIYLYPMIRQRNLIKEALEEDSL